MRTHPFDTGWPIVHGASVQIKALAEAGVTDNIVIPWVFDGLSFDAPIEQKKDSLKRFADTYIHSGWQDR